MLILIKWILLHPRPRCLLGQMYYLCFFSKCTISDRNSDMVGLETTIFSLCFQFLSPCPLMEECQLVLITAGYYRHQITQCLAGAKQRTSGGILALPTMLGFLSHFCVRQQDSEKEILFLVTLVVDKSGFCFELKFFPGLSLLAYFDENSKANKCWERCRVKGTLIGENINQYMEKTVQSSPKSQVWNWHMTQKIHCWVDRGGNKIDMLKTCLAPSCSLQRAKSHQVSTDWCIGKEEIKNVCAWKRMHERLL